MDADGKIDAAKLEAWIIKSQIDPNDSDNEDLMSRYFQHNNLLSSKHNVLLYPIGYECNLFLYIFTYHVII